ncbi:MAG: CRISPR-associated endonuclease Cas2 [Kiritimatiellaeota bacterium]|nr:CRISPR-associated endonuclease Cas2 [Kiritimatiellota bacterium]
MWILAMFDLPTNTKEERRDMTVFRKLLQSQGLFRMQFSVYVRFCDNKRLTDTILRSIRQGVPPHGEVRILYVTDKQYSEMHIFENTVKKRPEPEPEQLSFF